MKKDDFYSFMRKIPKAELHLHAEGTINRNTVRAFIDRHAELSIRGTDIEKLFSYNNLKEFIASFLFIQGLLEKAGDLKNVIEDVAVYLKENNVVYCELFFAPSMFLKKGFSFLEMLTTLQAAIDVVEKRDSITIKLIVDVSRTFGEENAQANLEAVLNNPFPMTIGIGLGGDEQKGPAKLFGDVFRLAKKKGLHVVAHAGEDDGPNSIWDSLRILGAERIGHGISAIQDPELVKYLAETKTPVEICLTSNLFTKKYVSKVKDHPVRPFFDAGIVVTVNTDDPTFFKVSLLDEYWHLHSKLNFSLAEIKLLVINGFNASFLDVNTKAKYIDQVEAAWKDAEAAIKGSVKPA